MRITFICLAALLSLGNASANETAVFNQRLGACDTQKYLSLRARCFEQLARDAIAKMDTPPPQQAPEAAKETIPASQTASSRYTDFVPKAKANVVAGLRDPSAVQWRGLYVSGSKMPALCGELNAKNAYGAYIGFRRFYATTNRMLTEIENPKDSYVFNGMWPKVCNEKMEDVE